MKKSKRLQDLTEAIQWYQGRDADVPQGILDDYDALCRKLEICDVLGCEKAATERPWCIGHHPWADEAY